MNLVLRGLEVPTIDFDNCLVRRLGEIGKWKRVDVIFTNPPFGGEEELGIEDDFPLVKRTGRRHSCVRQHTWPGGVIAPAVGHLRSLCRRAGGPEYWAYQRWYDIPLSMREQTNAFAWAKGWEYVE